MSTNPCPLNFEHSLLPTGGDGFDDLTYYMLGDNQDEETEDPSEGMDYSVLDDLDFSFYLDEEDEAD